jgi:hypothetical protein
MEALALMDGGTGSSDIVTMRAWWGDIGFGHDIEVVLRFYS